jgi:hypothetical protein
MKNLFFKNKFNIWMFFSLTIVGLISCQNEISLFEKNTVWQLVTEDSVYYEFYYDNNQQFIFDGKYAGLALVLHYDSISFDVFLAEICRSKDLKTDSAIIHSYFLKYCINNITITEIKPIGSFFYRISSDQHDNYMLYSREAYKRWRQFLGYDSIENLENDSLVTYDELELW